MFRLTQFMRELHTPTPTTAEPRRRPSGPVVIWNLVRRCNLLCRHCYTNSADRDYAGELDTEEVRTVMRDLRAFGVPVVILSGGEPLLRPDLFELAGYAKELGFYTALSSNGTLIDGEVAQRIANIGFDYVGISLDGIGATHDAFRRRSGAYDAALSGIRNCRDQGVKVGARFTLTESNGSDLPALLRLMQDEHIDKLYVSHLNYAGRGKSRACRDAHVELTRSSMRLLFDEAWRSVCENSAREFVTGNNDADAVFLLHWIAERFPDQIDPIRQKLDQWGGNASGVNVANIDNRGGVHPDSFWWDYTLGSVRERPFSEIWRDHSDPLMAGLNAEHRPLRGRCGTCDFVSVCNGNTRVRAHRATGDFWAEDPGCYLTDSEIRESSLRKPLMD